MKKRKDFPQSLDFFTEISFLFSQKGCGTLKQNLLITCAALCAVSVIVAFFFMLDSQPSVSPSPLPSRRAEEKMSDIPIGLSEPQTRTPEYQYLLKEYNGKLAVYFSNSQTPETVFDLYLSTLPEYDRGQLRLGVPVKDYEELVKRIEDYIS